MPSDKKYFNIRRFKRGVDMGVIDIPEEHLEMTLRNHPDWVNLGEIKTVQEPVAPPHVLQVGFSCPICGNSFGSEKLLQIHKDIHKPVSSSMEDIIANLSPGGIPDRISAIIADSPIKKKIIKHVKKVAIKGKRKRKTA